MCCFKRLNEVLLDWNNSDTQNNIIKSSNIKRNIDSLLIDKCFIYKTLYSFNEELHIFHYGWPEFDKYKNKVYINGEHVELNYLGYTIREFEANEAFKIYIEDLDKLQNCNFMFYDCVQLISVPKLNANNIYQTSYMFKDCVNLESVPLFNVKNIKDMKDMNNMFGGCTDLDQKTINAWSSVYDFKKHKMIK